MQFLTLALYFASLYVMFKHPHKERLAWGLFVAATVICFTMFFIASWVSVLPFGAY